MRVGERSRQTEAFPTPTQGLIWVAEQPVYGRETRQTIHIRGLANKERAGLELLWIGEGKALVQMSLGSRQLSHEFEAFAKRSVGSEQKRRVLLTLGYGEQFFCPLSCRVTLCPNQIKCPQPPQHGEKLMRISYLATQVMGVRSAP